MSTLNTFLGSHRVNYRNARRRNYAIRTYSNVSRVYIIFAWTTYLNGMLYFRSSEFITLHYEMYKYLNIISLHEIRRVYRVLAAYFLEKKNCLILIMFTVRMIRCEQRIIECKYNFCTVKISAKTLCTHSGGTLSHYTINISR